MAGITQRVLIKDVPLPSLPAGDEEDHDDDRGGWERAGGPLLHVGLPQVCAGGHTNHRVRLHTAASHYISITRIVLLLYLASASC